MYHSQICISNWIINFNSYFYQYIEQLTKCIKYWAIITSFILNAWLIHIYYIALSKIMSSLKAFIAVCDIFGTLINLHLITSSSSLDIKFIRIWNVEFKKIWRTVWLLQIWILYPNHLWSLFLWCDWFHIYGFAFDI